MARMKTVSSGCAPAPTVWRGQERRGPAPHPWPEGGWRRLPIKAKDTCFSLPVIHIRPTGHKNAHIGIGYEVIGSLGLWLVFWMKIESNFSRGKIAAVLLFVLKFSSFVVLIREETSVMWSVLPLLSYTNVPCKMLNVSMVSKFRQFATCRTMKEVTAPLILLCKLSFKGEPENLCFIYLEGRMCDSGPSVKPMTL